MALMRRQSLVKFDAPLCETVVETPKPQAGESGTLAEGKELMALARAGKVRPVPMQEKPMGEKQKWIEELRAGKVAGRIVLAN